MPLDMKHIKEGDDKLSFERTELQLPVGCTGGVVQKATENVIL